MEEQSQNETTPVEIKEEFDEDIISRGQQTTIVEQQQKQPTIVENQQQDQQQQINNNEPENEIAEQIPSWSTNLDNSGYPGFIEAIRQARKKKQSHDVSFEILFSYLPESVIKQHDLNLNEWWNYCLVENKDPLETDLSVVIGYLEKKYDVGASSDDLESVSSTICLIASDKMEKQMNSSRFLYVKKTDCFKTPKSSCQNDSITSSLHIGTKKQDGSKISSVQIDNVQKAKLSEAIVISDDELDTESPTTLLKKSKDLLNNNEPTNLKNNSVFLKKAIDSSHLITPLMKPTSTIPPAILLCPASKKKVSKNNEMQKLIKVLENNKENQQITIKNTSSQVPSISNVVVDDESDLTNKKYPTLIMPILKQQGKVIQQQQSTLSESDSKSISDLSDTSIDSDNSLDEMGPTNETESFTYLQKAIDNPQTTIVQDQVEGNSVKMLVVTPDGEQRLITFDIPNEKCTVHDLLEQAGIPFNGTTKISLVKDPILKINYIVEREADTIVDLTQTSDNDDDEVSVNNDKKNIRKSLKLQSALKCRTVKIGSYKYTPKEHVIINTTGLILSVPLLEDETETVKVHVQYQDIYKVLIHSTSSRPKLFFYTNTKSASKIRKLLGMNNPKGPFYDPAGKDQAHKRIILFPISLKSNSIMILKKLFSSNTLVKELNAKEADALLSKGASLKKPNNSSSKVDKRQTTIVNTNNIVENSTNHPAAPTKGEDTNKSITKAKSDTHSNKDTNANDKNNEKSNNGNDKLANSDSRKKTSSVIIKKPKLDKSQPTTSTKK